ncbi:hypothetical protein AVEN_76757-1 [Araneus ventricosus]|uniref:Uncharacterized protein n=1 Tax=Araneus ventricosus TaxID=182803 RepID=A0A4Y2S1F2_ARAVE|nr:hypothetical protein AVEN_76757-1 [Araneus ventricosus]
MAVGAWISSSSTPKQTSPFSKGVSESKEDSFFFLDKRREMWQKHEQCQSQTVPEDVVIRHLSARFVFVGMSAFGLPRIVYPAASSRSAVYFIDWVINSRLATDLSS